MLTWLLYPLILLTGISMCICQYLIYVYTPVEKNLGIVQKIFYFHLPLAWWGLLSFFVVFIASIIYLKTRRLCWDNLASTAAEIGIVLCTLTIVTGSIWGRHSWGIWWTWDPRLTTVFILWFLYTAYLLIRTMNISLERRALISSILGIVAFIDVPLVFISSRIWRSIHPTVFANKNKGLDSEMQFTVTLCVFCFGLFWLCLMLIRYRQKKHKQLIRSITLNTIL